MSKALAVNILSSVIAASRHMGELERALSGA